MGNAQQKLKKAQFATLAEIFNALAEIVTFSRALQRRAGMWCRIAYIVYDITQIGPHCKDHRMYKYQNTSVKQCSSGICNGKWGDWIRCYFAYDIALPAWYVISHNTYIMHVKHSIQHTYNSWNGCRCMECKSFTHSDCGDSKKYCTSMGNCKTKKKVGEKCKLNVQCYNENCSAGRYAMSHCMHRMRYHPKLVPL